MSRSDKKSGGQHTGWRKVFGEIRNRAGNETGASLVAAILFFVLCGVGSSVILAAASASSGKMQKVPEADQKRFAVESAAAFLRDELKDTKNKVQIKDVKVEDSRESEPDYAEIEYTYVAGPALDDSQILDALVKTLYRSMQDEDENVTKQDEAEKSFLMSVQTKEQKGTGTRMVSLGQLQAKVDFVMDADYNITALITDSQTGEEHPEDRCERKLTVQAKPHVDEMEETEDFEETDENGDVTKEWTITTTTRITTIYWERGLIERTHPGTEETGG